MMRITQQKLTNFFLKVNKNIKISWRMLIRSNKSSNASYIKLNDISIFLEVFNLDSQDNIVVICPGVSSFTDLESIVKDLLVFDNLTITCFRSFPVLTREASLQLSAAFPLEYATLTAFKPLIIVNTHSEDSWFLAVNYVLGREVEQSALGSADTILLVMLRNRSMLIDMRNSKNADQFRALFKNFKKKSELHLFILRMLGAKLARSFDWIYRFF